MLLKPLLEQTERSLVAARMVLKALCLYQAKYRHYAKFRVDVKSQDKADYMQTELEQMQDKRIWPLLQ